MSTLGTSGYRGRFAPSPTGALHFGSLVAALGSWLDARSAGGSWIVRIEDLDPPREQPGSAVDIIETLAAFGLVSDEPIEYQSARHAHYRAALERLVDAGHAYPCWCTRSELGPGNRHPRQCVAAPDPARAPAWRLRVAGALIAVEDRLQGRYEQDLERDVGDVVLRRADGLDAYHLAVVVDDAAQRISDVVRGADLLDSTPRQVLLQRLLGLPTPRYLHLPVATDAEGRKLSKQFASRPVSRGQPLAALRAALAFLGVDARAFEGLATPEAMLALALLHYDPARLPRQREIAIA